MTLKIIEATPENISKFIRENETEFEFIKKQAEERLSQRKVKILLDNAKKQGALEAYHKVKQLPIGVSNHILIDEFIRELKDFGKGTKAMKRAKTDGKEPEPYGEIPSGVPPNKSCICRGKTAQQNEELGHAKDCPAKKKTGCGDYDW